MIPFLTPRYLKDGKELHSAARKMLESQRDLLRESEVAELRGTVEALEEQLRTRDRAGIEAASKKVDEAFHRALPPKPLPWWRDNWEALLVAIVIAIGIRSYFIQPFTIPTGSMQPTLNGIIAYPSKEAPPGALRQVWDFAWLGRTHLNLVAEADDQIIEIREGKRLGFFAFTEIIGAHQRFSVRMPMTKLREFGIYPGLMMKKGEVIARGYVDTGDKVFVDKMTYHFRSPKRGEIFVFNTADIPRLTKPGEPSQYYIKRLAGVPGDELRIDSPQLYVNGSVASEPMFRKVMSMADGYRGYANAKVNNHPTPYLGTPDSLVRIGPKEYFALGDNSYNSLDSRSWGTVPERNLTGRGLMVFWPFNSHWGLMK